MAVAPDRKPQIPVPLALTLVALLVLLGIGILLLNRPAKVETPPPPVASSEVKGYVKNLELSEVAMSASESFTNQQLVEVRGKITNHGDRGLRSIEVFCIFYSPDGLEIHRERSTILEPSAAPLEPRQTRSFRLPFDALPPGWNQAVPRMVIASIAFVS